MEYSQQKIAADARQESRRKGWLSTVLIIVSSVHLYVLVYY